jgi:hypothetical protein
MAGVERALARLSAEEMVSALRLSHAPAPVRAALRVALTAVSLPLGRVLARFDARIESIGLSRAAAAALEDFGATWTRVGESPPPRGPLLVASNHPGAYDALALLAAAGRDDVAIVAADREFLRAMPALRRHLVLVSEAPPAQAMARGRGLREAIGHLRRGGALVHFAAGQIEPDPTFSLEQGAPRLAAWQAGTGMLVRALASVGGAVVPALVEGVHSARAKASLANRMAERRGVTTIAPLLQVAMPRRLGYREVAAKVHFGDAVRAPEMRRAFGAAELATASGDAIVTARLRERALGLWPGREHEQPEERLDRIVPSR